MEGLGVPMKKKRPVKLLSAVQKLKQKARGRAWEALHRAETSIARGEGRIKSKGIGRPKKKGKKTPK